MGIPKFNSLFARTAIESNVHHINYSGENKDWQNVT